MIAIGGLSGASSTTTPVGVGYALLSRSRSTIVSCINFLSEFLNTNSVKAFWQETICPAGHAMSIQAFQSNDNIPLPPSQFIVCFILLCSMLSPFVGFICKFEVNAQGNLKSICIICYSTAVLSKIIESLGRRQCHNADLGDLKFWKDR